MKKNILIFIYFILFTVYSDNALTENKPPRIISSSFDVDENTNLIGTIEARDRDGDSIQFFSSKPHIISVNKNSGVLRFVKAPNYEKNSSYIIKITASDGVNSKSKRIAININNVNEAPKITQKNYTWYLNDTRNISIEASDPENDKLFYELSGSDKNSFTVTKTGNLRLLSDENIKRKTVFNNLQLTINDGEYTDTKDIKLTVITDFLSLEETISQDSSIGNNFGGDIVLSSNGKRLLAFSKSLGNNINSSYVPGGISLFKYENRNWLKSFEIEGVESTERLGANAMDISSNGNIFAYMRLTKSGEDNFNHDASVRVYRYSKILDRYLKMGSKISAFTKFPAHYGVSDYPMPYNLSLDTTGKKLAVTNIERGSGGASCEFKIKTYKFLDNDWNQYGDDIDIGNHKCEFNYYHGVDLQDRGNTFATAYTDYDLGCGNGSCKTVIKTFSYNGSEWGQIGNTINPNKIEDLISDELSSAVTSSWHQLRDYKLNEKGNKLVIYTQWSDSRRQSGLFRFYLYEEDQGDWSLDHYLFIEPCSEDISDIYPSLYQCSNGETTLDAFLEIQSFDISDDMKTLAFEIQDNWAFYSPRFDGMTVVYTRKGKKWKRYASYICNNENNLNSNGANCANSIAMNKAGDAVFIGSPNFKTSTSNRGAVLKLKLNNID